MRAVQAILEARGRVVEITEPGTGDTRMAIGVKHGKGDGTVEVATRIRKRILGSSATTETEGVLRRGAETTKHEVIGDILTNFKDAIRMPVV